ncbi:hypothetical protein [Cellulomonas hominis]
MAAESETAVLVGNQAHVAWFDEEVLTLADLWPDPCWAVIVGVNPAPRSVTVGHYYQGANGRTALSRLRGAGLLPEPQGGWTDDEAVAAGIGFTDLVKRPSRAATDLRSAELAFGRANVLDQLAVRHVELVVCVFAPAARAMLGRPAQPGLHGDPDAGWVFRMPGPYAPSGLVEPVMNELAAFVTERRHTGWN